MENITYFNHLSLQINASVFDRSVPIDYKPSIKLISSKSNNKIPVELVNEEENEVSLKGQTSKTNEILNKIDMGESIVKGRRRLCHYCGIFKRQTIPRNEKDYYKHMGAALQKISRHKLNQTNY